jgi:hypothetical protein
VEEILHLIAVLNQKLESKKGGGKRVLGECPNTREMGNSFYPYG